MDWRFLLILVILLVFTNWLGTRWVFQRATLAGTDILLQQPKPVPAVHCTLITINEQEFDAYLGEWLQPEQLSSVFQNIVKYEPKVIVVDIDTSAPRFRSLVVPAGNSKFVWARVSHEALTGNRPRSYVWQAGAVLGNRPNQPDFSGSPLFPQDPDLTVRSYQRMLPIDAHAASLHWMTLRALCSSGDKSACVLVNNDTATDDLQTRPFLTDWDFRTIPLSDLMGTGGSTVPHAGGLGDVVLLGATFSDIHPTSFGPKLGIELTASAVESELAPKVGPWPIYEWSHWILKVLLAFAIVWLNNRLLPLWATTGTLLLLGLVFMASFLGIYYGIFRMDFLPFMIGIWIEQLIEAAEHAQHAAQ
jgi:CHASE2 domain-containing sensor protein